ncbi:hypothetical protein ACFX1S_013357 [Malus domestica]
MSIVAQSTSSFSSALSIKGSSVLSVSFFDGSTFRSAFLSCCASRRLMSVAIYKSFSSMVYVNLAIASLISACCFSIEVAPVVMTCMVTGYKMLFESALEVHNSKYLNELSSYSALSEARVIMS